MADIMLCDFKTPLSRDCEASTVIFLELTCQEEALANEWDQAVPAIVQTD